MKLRTLAATVGLALAATACASAETAGSGGIAHATGHADLVLRVDVGGGFVNPQAVLDLLPLFSLYGDGTVVTPGVHTEIYPGPAIDEPIATPITEGGVQAILHAAREAGLFRTESYTDPGSVGIADAPTTTITVMAGGGTFTTSVYALGEAPAGRTPGMGDKELRVRRAIGGFVDRLVDLRRWLPRGSVGADEPFRPSALAVYVGAYRPDGSLDEPATEWPLPVGLAGFGHPLPALPDTRCAVVAGGQLAKLMPLAQGANQLTPWASDGRRFGLSFRPLLPDQSGC